MAYIGLDNVLNNVTDADTSAKIMQGIYEPMLNTNMGAFASGYESPFAFNASSLMPSFAQSSGWGGPATAWQGQLGEGLNGVTNKLASWGSALGQSKPVETFKSMPGTDQFSALAGMASSLNGIWQGHQNNKMMNKQFGLQKDMFNKQYGLAKSQYNSELSDRQSARVASNPNAYQGVSSYMKQYGL